MTLCKVIPYGDNFIKIIEFKDNIFVIKFTVLYKSLCYLYKHIKTSILFLKYTLFLEHFVILRF